MLAAQEQFKKELQINYEAVCPCCKRRARVNKLSLHSTLALMLARLYYVSTKLHGEADGWVHIEAFKPKTRTGNDFSIVKHWNLAVPKAADKDDDKRSSGMWKLTEEGVLFVENHHHIWNHLFVLDDAVVMVGSDFKNIEHCIKKRFSYSELFEHLEAGKELFR